MPTASLTDSCIKSNCLMKVIFTFVDTMQKSLFLMRLYYLLLFITPLFGLAQSSDSIMLANISHEVMLNGQCYQNLNKLCKEVGGRLSGSPQASRAVSWAYRTMSEIVPNQVRLQECMVPHWVRGPKEEATIYRNGASPISLNVCALGNSVATPEAGVKAKVVEILRWSQLDSLGAAGKLTDKIVFFNRPMKPQLLDPGAAYGDAVDQRWGGPSKASHYGAVATICRSSTHAYDQFPHTGAMGYDDKYPKIAALSVSTMDAEVLSNELKTDPNLELFMKDYCEMLPDEKSYNVIGEITGTQHSNEIITIGGHLDSWDLAEGAHDDGTGVVQAIEVIRIFKALGIKPKRTIRAVAFMNEENGGRGGKAYAEEAKLKNEKHIAAIESDGGGFAPLSFGASCDSLTRQKLNRWLPLLKPYQIYYFGNEGGGADINPLKKLGAATFGLEVDGQRYFDYHHTANDVFENVNKRELEMGAACMAQLAWLLSER